MNTQFPIWCDHEKVLAELNNYRERVRVGHAHTISSPNEKVCSTGLVIWPVGHHTYGGDLIPCLICGGQHNIYNFYKNLSEV